MKFKKIGQILFWAAIVLFSAYFYYTDAIPYLFGYRSDRFGNTFFHYQFWFVAHIVGATCSLFLGPIQFAKSLRIKYIKSHRMAGKIYVFGSLLAGVAAIPISLNYDCIACRYSLVILAVLFLLTTALAWYAILQRNIVAHQQFMVRSYTCALAFVFVRLHSVLPLGFLFTVIDDPGTRRILKEAIFSFMPLLIVEIVMMWIPSLRKFNPSTK